MNVKLLTEHHLELLSLIGGCTGSSESKLVKMPHCWKSHVVPRISAKAEDFNLTAHKRVRSEYIFRCLESEYIEGGLIISHLRNLQIRMSLLRCSVLFVERFLEWRQCLRALLKMH